MALYDAHNHLQDQRLLPYRDGIVHHCESVGFTAVVNGTCSDDWRDVAALASHYRWIVPSFGYHPWYLMDAPSDWYERLCGYLDMIPSGVGEIGLDLWKEGLDRDLQEHFFVKQLSLAAQRNLPASIHCLRAWDWLRTVLAAAQLPSCGFVLHSFSGEQQHIRNLVDKGGYFSCAGYFLHPRKRRTLENFRYIPHDRILIETDAPDQCLPEELDLFKLRRDGERLNHPGNLRTVYEHLAHGLGLSTTKLEQQVEENFHRLFGGVMR
jgi:TatD DNase family protein